MPPPSSSSAHSRMTIGLCVRWWRVADTARITAALAEEAWSIVLRPHRMPAFDAFTALAVLGASGVDLPFIVVSGESGEETAVVAIRAGAADFVSLDHVDCLGVMVARYLRHKRAARRMRAQADAAARESRERYQTSIETLRPLRDQPGRIVDFVYEYENGAACVANNVAREDLVGMRVLDRISRSTASTTRRAT
jgi:DNA-binding NtrC family response regulator